MRKTAHQNNAEMNCALLIRFMTDKDFLTFLNVTNDLKVVVFIQCYIPSHRIYGPIQVSSRFLADLWLSRNSTNVMIWQASHTSSDGKVIFDIIVVCSCSGWRPIKAL
jgi:hypothetical protein